MLAISAQLPEFCVFFFFLLTCLQWSDKLDEIAAWVNAKLSMRSMRQMIQTLVRRKLSLLIKDKLMIQQLANHCMLDHLQANLSPGIGHALANHSPSVHSPTVGQPLASHWPTIDQPLYIWIHVLLQMG